MKVIMRVSHTTCTGVDLDEKILYGGTFGSVHICISKNKCICK